MKWVPSLVTLAGGLLSVLAIGQLATRPLLGVLLLALAWLLDLLDGALARRLNAVSEFGAQLDWAIDVAVVHGLLAHLGLTWAVVPVAVLQALTMTAELRGTVRSIRHDPGGPTLVEFVRPRRVSGRTTLVCVTAGHALGVW